MYSLDQSPVNLYGTLTPSGTAPAVIPLAANGGDALPRYRVSAGKTFVATQLVVAAKVATTAYVQRSRDGVAWHNVIAVYLPSGTTQQNVILAFVPQEQYVRVIAQNEDELGAIFVNIQGYEATIG